MRLGWAIAVVLVAAQLATAERIKDIVDIQGVRGNQLVGLGLVVGLNGSGDNSQLARQMLNNHLRRSGLVMDPDDLASKNIAAVEVTAELPPFSRTGSRIDVAVSAISGASSLQGGMLLLTELTGADGEVYAVAQGALTLGGFAATGENASVSKNHTTVGYISAGATVEREELACFDENGEIVLLLRNPDFSTAQRIAEEVKSKLGTSCFAPDAGSVRVRVPQQVGKAELAGYIDRLGSLTVEVDSPAVVVINERTGTIIIGQNVGISTVAIAHGSLSIVTQEKDFASQPQPFSNTGNTEKLQRTDITTVESGGQVHVIPRQVSVSELARALNAMGLTPRDIISIFEALRQAGALQAELRIM